MYPLTTDDDLGEVIDVTELVELAVGTEPTPRFSPEEIIRQFDDIPTVNTEPPNISIARLKLAPRSVPPPLPRRERAASPTVELEPTYAAALRKRR